MCYGKKYNYFYKITNNINNHFYYGIHSTNDLNDGYMGSGTRLTAAYNKYGEKNFTKQILKFFNSFYEACQYEKQIVTEELVNDNNCYNLVVGGYYLTGDVLDKLKQTLKEKHHQCGEKNSNFNKKWIHKDDICKSVKIEELNYFLNNGWFIGKGKFKNKSKIIEANSNRVWVCKENEKSLHIKNEEIDKYLEQGYIKGRKYNSQINKLNNKKQKFSTKGKIVVKYKDGKNILIDKNDERYLSGELKPFNKGMIVVKDKDGNHIGLVSVDDERYKSGELIQITTGMKHKKESKDKMSKTKKAMNATWVNNGKIHKFISKNNIDEFLKNNLDFVLGRIKK